jgi:paraquat-inducible protein B
VVACDGICQKWHHLSCAELQLRQFNVLKSANKRKSKLTWLGYGCEQDFILFKAGKNMQKAITGMRVEMNMKINEMIVVINKLKFEHQTSTFARNKPAAEQQVKTDEARGTVIKKSKDTTEEKTRPQESDMQRSNKQTEINNEEAQEESTAQTGQSKEKGDETEQHRDTGGGTTLQL